MEKRAHKKHQKEKKLPKDHRHRRWSPRAQLLTTCQCPSPTLPAAYLCSDTSAINGRGFWHNKPQRPEKELPDSPWAQMWLLQVINFGKTKSQSDAQDIAPRLSMATASPVAAGVTLLGFATLCPLGFHAAHPAPPASITGLEGLQVTLRGSEHQHPQAWTVACLEVKSLCENVIFNITLGFLPSVKHHPREFGDTLNETMKRCVCFRCNWTAVLLWVNELWWLKRIPF